MPIVSKFRGWIAFLVIVFFAVTAIIIMLVVTVAGKDDSADSDAIWMILITAIFAIIWSWLFFGEFRKRAVVLRIEKDRIVVKSFLGLGRIKTYLFTELEGFETFLLPAEHKTFEYLYLMKRKVRVVAMSEFYHDNYQELKVAVVKKVKNLGEKKYSILHELRRIF